MPELTPRRRRLVLAICCMSLLIVSLDNTVLNVALPSMQHELHATTSGLQWTIDAYTVVMAALLMLAGSTADRIGRKRVFMTGLVVFGLGSLLCSLAPSLESLVVFRMVQAVGGSMLNPVAMSIITNTFTDPRERARAIGAWGAVVGISMAAGPVVGGLLVESVGWRSIFWINLPVGLAALLLTLRFIPESRAPRARRVDPVGQLLVITLLGSLTYAIIEAPESGAGTTAPFAVLALASVLGLLWYEPRRDEPLIDLRFFRSMPFSGATVIAVCAFSALGGFLFVSTLYLQNVRGLDALHAGLWMLPMAVPTFLCAPLSGRLVGSRGPRIPLLIAGCVITVSAVLFAVFEAQTSNGTLFLGYALFGIGFGFVNAPITNTAVSGMPRAQAGVAAAVASTSRQVGQTLGVAVLGSVLAAGISRSAYRETFVDASGPAWWIIVGCGLAILLVGAATSGPWARATALRTAEHLRAPEVREAARLGGQGPSDGSGRTDPRPPDTRHSDQLRPVTAPLRATTEADCINRGTFPRRWRQHRAAD
jgi:EmrB/QacA subfamily drug resistance transporter